MEPRLIPERRDNLGSRLARPVKGTLHQQEVDAVAVAPSLDAARFGADVAQVRDDVGEVGHAITPAKDPTGAILSASRASLRVDAREEIARDRIAPHADAPEGRAWG